jgi:23S rRNA pseudouridine2605 synthase/16S rRNA pseudouridine516 synthase
VLPLEEAASAVRAGRVRVNGRVQTQPLAASRPEDVVTLDGVRVSLAAPTRALVLHKPAGVVCSRRDPEHEGTVFDALAQVLPPSLRGFSWHAAGRLDRQTTGFLLFTNDERLLAHVTSPKTHLPKRYLATVSGSPGEAALEPLRRGMLLDDGPTRPAQARLRNPRCVELTLTEGRHHQVKRMLGALGFPVLMLHREAVGGVELDVPVAQMRELTQEEIRGGLGFEARGAPVPI